MSGTERVVFAFRATGEAGQAFRLTQGANAITTACQDLMRVSLMANIPDDTVIWSVEYGV